MITATSVDQCIDRIIDYSLLDYRARRIGMNRISTRLDDEIRILSDIQFNCSTIINSVILGIDVRPNRDSFPSVQIWRSTGEDVYAFVPGSERFIFYTPENVSRTGVYDYPLEPPLEVEPGDLLAFSQPPLEISNVRGYYIDAVNFNSHRIDFADTTADLSGSPINNNLVLVYPILTGKYKYILNNILNYLQYQQINIVYTVLVQLMQHLLKISHYSSQIQEGENDVSYCILN